MLTLDEEWESQIERQKLGVGNSNRGDARVYAYGGMAKCVGVSVDKLIANLRASKLPLDAVGALVPKLRSTTSAT